MADATRVWHHAKSATFTTCGIKVTDEPKIWWRNNWRHPKANGKVGGAGLAISCKACWAVHDKEKAQKATDFERLRGLTEELREIRNSMANQQEFLDLVGEDEIVLLDWHFTIVEADLLLAFLDKGLNKPRKETEPIEQQWHADPKNANQGRRI